jgi:hypothetical protein
MSASEVVQKIRIKHRWENIQKETLCKEVVKGKREKYCPKHFENENTRKKVVTGSRYLLFKSGEKWTNTQRKRAKILFEQYPHIRGKLIRSPTACE